MVTDADFSSRFFSVVALSENAVSVYAEAIPEDPNNPLMLWPEHWDDTDVAQAARLLDEYFAGQVYQRRFVRGGSGYWLLGSNGSKEAGVCYSLAGLYWPREVQKTYVLYTRTDLLRFFRATIQDEEQQLRNREARQAQQRIPTRS